MKPKILILGDYPSPGEIISGGIMRSVYLTANALAKDAPQYDFHVLTATDKIVKNFELINENLTIHYIHFPLRNKPILVPKFLYKQMIINEIRKINPDLIHANGTGWDYGYPAVAWKKCPVIITVHGISQNESKYWTGIKGAWHRITCREMEYHILKRAKNIITVTPYVQNEVHKITFPTEANVISNPVDHKFFNIIKHVIPNRLLFVGGIEERKGLEVLINALYIVKKTIPNITLSVVGGVRSPFYCADIVKLICDLKLDKNVNFNGIVSDTRLMSEYSNTAIYISPSYEESEGITILEAMATGTPVIATRSGGAESIIRDNTNGLLVECGNADELAYKILICGDALQEHLGEAGCQSALKYLPENIAKQHLEIYRRLLK
jgi:glycosyltransferase involved in cell wall biosynthesis